MLATVFLFASLTLSQERPDVMFADFEGDAYGRWTATGTAFGKGPARGAVGGQMAVGGFHGRGLANSFHGGDRSTGRLTSPEFRIERKYIAFLIGGGGFGGKTCINLEVGGKVVRTAAGPNTQPGGSERLSKTGWDVADLTGKTARLVIVDDATGGWGHVNVDHIVFTDQKPPAMLVKAERTLKADGRFLLLPVKNDEAMRKMRVFVEGAEVRTFDIELAEGKPDWWATLDLSAWRGKGLKLVVDRLPEGSKALEQLTVGDDPKHENLYREPLRPQLHFSPRRGWTNDPNGLVFHEGTYHLFFQHNPYGWKWGNMHWGHATSRDLVHWKEVGEALYPDAMGPMFSGSAVVDWNNTSGLGKDGKPPLILAYTAFGPPATQCLAFSNDGGKNFTKYAGNPVLKEITPGNRDPKVVWHEPSRKWVQVLYVEKKPKHFIQFFTSANLKDWEYTSEIDGFFECPDLFELPIAGTNETRWVLTAADSQYTVGTFDGRKFTPETPKLPGHRGKGFYAAQTFSDLPKEDGRRIQVGWLQAPSPGMPFNQCMSLPLELTLRRADDGLRLAWTPARELLKLLRGSKNLRAGEPLKCESELLLVRTVLRPKAGAEAALDVRGVKIVYQADAKALRVNELKIPLTPVDGKVALTIFTDRTALEIFANDGLVYVPLPFIPDPNNRTVRLHAATGGVESAAVHELLSIWGK